jgi:hypothetical protein
MTAQPPTAAEHRANVALTAARRFRFRPRSRREPGVVWFADAAYL